MKKAVFLLVLVALLGSVIYAEEAHKNVISFGSSGVLGVAVGYERMLSSHFSLTLETGFGLAYLLSPSYYASVGMRLYPFSDSDGKPVGVFVSCGVGYGEIEDRDKIFAWEKDNWYDIWGLMASSSFGVKIGANKPRGFIFTPMLGADFFFGEKTTENYRNTESKFGWGYNPHIKLLFGYAF